MAKIFEKQRKAELQSRYSSDYNFAEAMQEASMNEAWKSKTPLWTLLSAACNDVANDYYVKLNSFVQELADVDTCTIHTLKSMAKSVDASYLTDSLNENYPDELLKLINLFSIPKNILVDRF